MSKKKYWRWSFWQRKDQPFARDSFYRKYLSKNARHIRTLQALQNH
jgi:phage pi2 protein 07